MDKKGRYPAAEYLSVYSENRLPHLQAVLATKRKRKRGLSNYQPQWRFKTLPAADGSVLD